MSVHQCATCQHWQARGGIVTPRRFECVTLEDEERRAGPRLAAIVTRMAQTMARRNQCPAYSPWPLEPDCYRAEDLPLAES